MTYEDYLASVTERAIELSIHFSLLGLGGKPITVFDEPQTLDQAKAYEVQGDNFNDFFTCDGLEHVTHLAAYLEDNATLVDHADSMPDLSVLLLSCQKPIDVANLLDAYPNMHTLWVPGEGPIQSSVIRHTFLERLFILGPMEDDFLLNASFPRLKALTVNGGNLAALLNPTTVKQQFGALYNLGLNLRDYNGRMSDITLPHVSSLELNDAPAILDEYLEDIGKQAMAKGLLRLSFQSGGIDDPSVLNSDRFPALTELSFRFEPLSEEFSYIKCLSGMSFKQGVSVDLRNAGICDEDVAGLCEAVQRSNIIALNLEHNNIVGEEEAKRLQALDIPINLQRQTEP